MRDEKRGPGLRGNILVEEGDPATTGSGGTPADPAATDQARTEQAAATPSAGPGSLRRTIRPDAGTHATGPNPVVSAEPGARPEPEARREPTAEAKPGTEADAEPALGGAVIEPAHIAAPVPASSRVPELYRVPEPGPEPSWGKVLATTVSLWASRRFGRGRSPARAVAVYGVTEPPTPSSRWGGVRWPLVVFVLLLVILALVGLQLSGALSTNRPAQTATGPGGSAGNSGSAGSLSAATAARNNAASWIAQQVTSSDLIACDPLMCSTLQSDGVAASRLMSMQPTSTDPLGADVVAATSSIRSQFGSRLVSEYAPELIASFGSGASQVDIRAVANFGAAAFEAKEQADLAARKAAGKQLLSNGFRVSAQGASQIRAGLVDSRLLVTLAALQSQRPVQVSSFGDTGPGAPVLYRQVTVVNTAGQTGTTALRADLKQVNTQRNSYLPAHAQIVRLAHGQSALRIEFGAPDQPGLLSGGNS
jgi:hypothetical protein